MQNISRTQKIYRSKRLGLGDGREWFGLTRVAFSGKFSAVLKINSIEKEALMKEIQTVVEAIEVLLKNNPEYGENIKNMLQLTVRAMDVNPNAYLRYALELVNNFEKMVIAHNNMDERKMCDLISTLRNYVHMLGITSHQEMLEVRTFLLKG
ncbi:MAG: hypothetical protein WC238_03420 [Parcubacteria group bacterium]|jgi:hypothetical protein